LKSLLSHIKRFLVVGALLIHTASTAQIIGFRNFDVSDGLPSSIVYHACEDDQGFLWFGSDHGVSRYDGYYFDNFTTNDGLTDNEILKVFTDSKKRVWFLTLNGELCYYLDGTIYNKKNDPRLEKCVTPRATVNLFEDYFGNLWFSSQGESITLVDTAFNVTQFELPVKSKFPGVIPSTQHAAYPIHSEIDSSLYVYFNDKIYKYDYSNKKFNTHKELGFFFYNIFNYETKSNATFYNEYNNVFEILNDSIQLIFTFNKPLARYVMTRSEAIFMIGKDYSVETYDHITNQKIRLLTNTRVNSALEDKNSNIWFCTRGKGVFLWNANSRNISFIGKTSQEEDVETHSVLRSSHNELLWGENGSWLGRYDLSNKTFTKQLMDEVPDVRLINIIETEKRDVVLGLDDRMIIIHPDGTRHDLIVFTIENNKAWLGAKDFTIDNQGTLWFPTASAIYYWDTNSSNYECAISEALKGIRGFSIAADENDKLWVGSLDGTYLISNPKSKQPEVQKVTPYRCLDIDPGAKGTMILATENNGILFYRNYQLIKTIDYQSELQIDHVRCFSVDGDTLWCGTNKGLKKITLNSDFSVAQVLTYGENEGLHNMDVRDTHIDDNVVYAATNHGLIRIPKTKSMLVPAVSNTYIRQISGTWGKVFGNKPIDIDYLNNNLLIEFSSISMNHNNNVVFQYSIDSDENWQTLHTRNLSLNNLPFGQHRINIRSQIFGADWSKPESILVKINAPFWKATWFYLALILFFFLVIGTVIYMYYRNRILQLRQITTVKAERERISVDLHDDVGADLTRIALLAERLKQDDEPLSQRNIADKIISNAGGLRQKADQIIWALNPGYDSTSDLSAYLHFYGKGFLENSDLTFHFKDEILQDINLSSLQRRNIFLIYKEALNNVVKHAKATDVNIFIKTDNNQLFLCVEDNGIGVNAPKSRTGLKSMSKRAEEINAVLLIRSEPNTKGTKLCLTLPL
jgi:ligand-binding sensor domain-containing protein